MDRASFEQRFALFIRVFKVSRLNENGGFIPRRSRWDKVRNFGNLELEAIEKGGERNIRDKVKTC